MRLTWAISASWLCFAALAGCGVMTQVPNSGAVPEKLARPAMPSVPVDKAAVRKFQNIELRLRARGSLRTEFEPTDAPFTATDLTRDFVNIALFQEFFSRRGEFTRSRTKAALAKWRAPVQVELLFGGHIPQADRDRVTGQTVAVLKSMSRASGHPIGFGKSPNMHVFVVSEAERQALAPTLRAIAPRMQAGHITTLTNLSPTNYCAVMAFSSNDAPHVYDKAIVIIRAELSPFMQKSCLHEEIAQGLGLPNDSPQARPSVFNDDEEFAFLTAHDLLLLKMLYNPALRPGMKVEDAGPVALGLAAALVPNKQPAQLINTKATP